MLLFICIYATNVFFNVLKSILKKVPGDKYRSQCLSQSSL